MDNKAILLGSKNYQDANDENYWVLTVFFLLDTKLKELCSIKDWKENFKNVIVCEVLKDNPKEELKDILKKILLERPNQVIIKIPSRENIEFFNKNFPLDHNENNDKEEFVEILPKVEGYSLEIKGIKDKVEVEHISLLVEYKRN